MDKAKAADVDADGGDAVADAVIVLDAAVAVLQGAVFM
jgi:hypothetical protein